MGSGLATVLLDVLSLVKAGFELKNIVAEAQVMESKGATDEEISAWLRKKRDDAMSALDKALE